MNYHTKTYVNSFDIRDYGAVADGKTLSTEAIQSAIDACCAYGGGTVLIAQGVYLTGTIQLSSGITLFLDRSATLLGSPDIRHYRDFGATDDANIYRTPVLSAYPSQAILYAKDADDLGIIGGGTIDGQGQMGKCFPNPDDAIHGRPTGIFFENCERVSIKDITINNTAFWCTRFVQCKEMTITGVRIHSLQSTNGDGLDFIGGQDITISDCVIRAGDDCISLKAFESEHILRCFVITNCIMTSVWAAIRLGAESNADMRDITVSNCVFDCCGDGLKIQNSGGAIYENMIFSDIVMRNVERPFFIVLNSFTFSLKPPCRPVHTQMRNLVFKDITATVSHDQEFEDIVCDKIPCVCVSGTMDNRITGCTFENLVFHSQGGVMDRELAQIDVPEFLDYTGLYAESRHFKRPCAPANSMYIRHVENCTFRNIRFSFEKPDIRPMMVLDDAVQCDFSGIKGQGCQHTPCMILTAACTDLEFENCKVSGAGTDIQLLMEVSGEQERRYHKSVEIAHSIDGLYFRESLVADAARAARQLVSINDWVLTADPDGCTYTTTVDIPAMAFNDIYLYFEWMLGNVNVLVNGQSVASRHLPEQYQWHFFWAVSMRDFIRTGKNSICVKITGGQGSAGIYRPVHIRID